MSIKVGKTGTIRLKGKDKAALWDAMWERDKGRCVDTK